MDDEEPKKSYPLSPSKMSKASSWAMLGFFLGAASVWGLKRDADKAAAKATTAATVTLKEWPKAARPERSELTKIEAVFAAWGQHAVWDNNVTEVALWQSSDRDFSEFYEVRKVGDALYFRSIPKLTRLVIRHGVPLPKDSPLEFTETEAQYREWLEHGRFERQTDATVQPSLFGPALIPAGETMRRMPLPEAPPRRIENPTEEPAADRAKIVIPPKP
jgi:hypothetical protein